jgi:hypothetical protein
VVLRWPATATNLFLESATNLATGAVWTAVTNIPSVQGANFVLTNDAVGARFYRLRGLSP